MQRIIRIILILVTMQGVLSAQAEETRPKVGLVLGGGGALGFAHIGVLKVLEEEQIPIDYIAGTSIGAIVGGMYASGMSPAEIERQFVSLNWWQVLRDQSPHQFLDYRKKLEDKQFMGMEFGLKNWKPVFSPGVAYGQKLNNVLETFSINSAGITDFDQLNIPYRAVATDLRSGTPVALNSGSLAQAMRASMAVPGAFTPVRLNDMVLVDGGILNNMPVDVVEGMGADIIIAVDVGASSANRHKESDFRSLGDVAARAYSLMQRPAQEKQVENANVVIAPLLSDFSASHFHKAAEIIPTGEKAAGLLRKQLSPYGVNKTEFQNYLKKQRQVNTEEISISEIRVSGNETVSDTVIRNRIKTQPGPLLIDSVYDDLSRIYGMGDFQTVTYDLIPTNSSYELEFNTAEKFWGPAYLHFGMKLEIATDATALWSVLLNYTRTQMNPLGGEVRIDFEGGGHKRLIFGEWYQPVSHSGRFFIAPMAGYSSEDIDVYVDNTDVANVEQQLSLGALDAGVSGFEYGEFRLGLLGGHANVKGYNGLISLDEIDDTVVGTTTRLRLDQLNDPVFPTTGYQLELDGLFAFEELGSSETFSKLELKALAPVTRGPHTLIPKVSLGSSLGTEQPFYALFDAGGIDSFAGYAPYQLRGNYYGIGNLSYRYRLGRLPPALGHGIFAVLRIDAGNAWFDASEARLDNLDYGWLAGLGADTILGTCKLAVGKAESTTPRLYFTIGNEF